MSATPDELAALIGRSGARAIASLYGGQRLQFGAELRPGSPLEEMLGELIIARLVAHFGSELVTIPMPPLAAALRIAARDLRRAGCTAREIAAKLGISERQAWRAIAEDSA